MFLFSLDELLISVYAYTICVELLYLASRGLIGFFYLPVLAYKYHTRPYILREFIPTSSSYLCGISSLEDNTSRSVVAPSVVVAGGPFFTNCFGESISLSSLVSSPVVTTGGIYGATSRTSKLSSVVASHFAVAGGIYGSTSETSNLSCAVPSPVGVAGGVSFASYTSKTSSPSFVVVASPVVVAGGTYTTTSKTSTLSSVVVSPVDFAGGISLVGTTGTTNSLSSVVGTRTTSTSITSNEVLLSGAVSREVLHLDVATNTVVTVDAITSGNFTTADATFTNSITCNTGVDFFSWSDTTSLPDVMPCEEDIEMKDASPLLKHVSSLVLEEDREMKIASSLMESVVSSFSAEEDIEMSDAPPLLEIASDINKIDAGDLVCPVSLFENTDVTSNALLERSSSGVSFFCFGKKTLPKQSWIKSGFIKKGSCGGVSRHFARVVGDVFLPGQTIYSIKPGFSSSVPLKNEEKKEHVVEEHSSLESVEPLAVPSVVPTPTLPVKRVMDSVPAAPSVVPAPSLPAKRVMDSVPAAPAAKRGVLVEAAVVSKVETAAVPSADADVVPDVPTMISPSAPSRPVRTPSLRLEKYKKKYSLKTTVFEEYKQKEKTVADISALFDEAEEEEERKEEEKKKKEKGKGRFGRFNL